MSGILESESDNDDSTQSSCTSSTHESLRQQATVTGIPTTGNMVQSRLEHFSRRLSLLGLASTQEINERPGIPEKPNVIEPLNSAVTRQDPPASTSLKTNKLPQDTDEVLQGIKHEDKTPNDSQDKVQIKFQPIGSIPQINPSVCRITATQPFSLVIAFLTRRLKVDQVYCYVNNSFSPNPQLIVGDLWSQFKVDDELIVSYCGTTAFG